MTDMECEFYGAKPSALNLSVPLLAVRERAAELNFREAEAVAQAIRGARQTFEFFAAVRDREDRAGPSPPKTKRARRRPAATSRAVPERAKRSRIAFRNTVSRSDGSASV